MVFGKLKTPQLQLGKFTEFIKSKEVIAVGAAILITPVLLSTITAVVSRFPLLRDNFAIGLAIAAFVIFLISSMFSGMPRAIILGVAAGVLITAIQSTSFAQEILARLGGAT